MVIYQIDKMQIEVFCGDILKLASKVDALLYSDDERMSAGGGLAKRIVEASGVSSKRSSGELQRGDVLLSHAGSLSCKYILAIVSVKTETLASKTLTNGVPNLLEKVAAYSIESIAIPALGTGMGGLSFQEFSQLLLENLYEYRKKFATLKKIIVTVTDKGLEKSFIETLRQHVYKKHVKISMHNQGIAHHMGFSQILEEKLQHSFTLSEKFAPKNAKLTISACSSSLEALISALLSFKKQEADSVEKAISQFTSFLEAFNVLSQTQWEIPELEKDRLTLVQKSLAVFYDSQNENGGWGWWPQMPSHPFITALALCSLRTLKSNGYPINQKRIDDAIAFIKPQVAQTTDKTLQTYILYSLALHGQEIEPILQKYFPPQQTQHISPFALSLLIHIYFQQKQSEKALPLRQSLMLSASKEEEFLYWGVKNARYWQSDAVVITAWVIKALALIDPEFPMIAPAIEWLLLQRQGEGWKSSRENAFCISALLSKLPSTIDPSFVSIKIAEKEVERLRFDKNSLAGCSQTVKSEDLQLQSGENSLSLVRLKGPSKLYVSGSLSYYCPTLTTPSSTVVKISRELFSLQKNSQTQKYDLISISSGYKVALKTPLVFLTKIQSSEKQEYIEVTDYIPATAELLSEHNYQITDLKLNYGDYQKVQGNCITTYFVEVPAKEEIVITTLFSIKLPGKCVLDPAQICLHFYPQVNSATERFELET